MRIESFWVSNYKSYNDSGEIPLAPGMNVVVGKNSVGKSALMEAMGLRFSGRPRRSVQSLPHFEDAENPNSEVLLLSSFSGSELRRSFLRVGQQVFLARPNSVTQDAAGGRALFEEVFKSKEVKVRLRAIASANNGASIDAVDRTAVSWDAGPPVDSFAPNEMFALPAPDRRDIGNAGPGGGGWSFGTLAAQTLLPRLFRFQAERLNIGSGVTGRNSILASDASNLHEALLNLQSNPDQFREYEGLVRQVFPLIEAITLQPFDNNQVEIRIWQLPRESRRSDLAFPLSQCGTGIGQVMAILYVVASSADPQTLLIDEPNSFLHPGAARALIRVLRRFAQHQYIVATHAPEVIAEAGACPVICVDWDKGSSTCTSFPERTTAVSRQLLTDVGARLGDVFGFDHVLWVEGPSDRACFSAIIAAKFGEIAGLAILPVRDTGNFERRKAADIVGIYRQASMGSALLPPSVGFILDREGRTEKEIQVVGTETKGAVSFLERRMLENYLIEPRAISEVMTAELGAGMLPITEEDVNQWLKVNAGSSRYGASDLVPQSSAWLANVHGSRLLGDVFLDLTAGKVEFRKTKHCAELTATILKNEPNHLDELLRTVMSKLRESSQ